MNLTASSAARRSSSKPTTFQRTQLCLAISAMLAPVWAFAAPVVGPNGGVTSGAATIVQSGAVTDINQSSNKAVINWQSFSTSPNETVNFNQPNVSSVTLNRVIGNEKSVLQGALNATGKVYLVNANGVLISKGATVNTSGFVASTLNISDDDFNNGNLRFQSNGTAGSVTNLGTITVTDGGYVVLLGNLVSNQGTIVATKGTVSLNAGNKVTLNFNGDSLLSVTIDEGALNALVENKQAIYADGGQVIMTARAADELLGAQVNNSGIVQAQTIGDLKGSIEIYAHGGTANIDGTLDASAPTTGNGGFIETSGDVVNISDSAHVTTLAAYGKNGKWLIDPNDFTVAASGGNMTAAAIVNALNTNGEFEINTRALGTASGNGDINVNQAISWNTPSILTLNAERNVNINSAITATGNSIVVGSEEKHAGLTLIAGTDININAPVKLSGTKAAMSMTYGGDYNIRTKASYSGTVLDANGIPVAKQDTSGDVYGSITLSETSATLNINGDAYTLIHRMDQLDYLDGQNNAAGGSVTGTDVTGKYALAENLDATGNIYNGVVVGKLSNATLAGLGNTINGLNIGETTATTINVLIGTATAGSVIRDIGLTNVAVTNVTKSSGTANYFGPLVGRIEQGTIVKRAYAIGSVNATGNITYATGLIGYSQSSSIIDSFSEVAVTNTRAVAGLVALANQSTVSNSHVKSTLLKAGNAIQSGGLIASAVDTLIDKSYATATLVLPDTSSTTGSGGLVGSIGTDSGTSAITDSFASGTLTGGTNLGGLVGNVKSNSILTIANSHANVDVTANFATDTDNFGGIGGLVGSVGDGNTSATIKIENSYATGNIKSTTAAAKWVGGLVGYINDTSRTSLISGSYATGNVDASLSSYVGGLLGNSVGASVTGSYATGNVTGYNVVGGLAGSFQNGNIDTSYSKGKVIGLISSTSIDHMVGGLIGGASQANIDSSVYYNAEGVNGSLGNAPYFSGGIDSSKGLNTTQLADIQHYANGTIDQVLADRAAHAAATKQAEAIQQARIEDARQQTNSIVKSLQREAANVVTASSFTNPTPSIDSQIVFADTQNFSADVKSIIVDGVRFNLEEEDTSKEKTDK